MFEFFFGLILGAMLGMALTCCIVAGHEDEQLQLTPFGAFFIERDKEMTEKRIKTEAEKRIKTENDYI